MGGLGGVVALVVAYRRQRVDEDANRRAEAVEERERRRMQYGRFAQAASMLGHGKAPARLAGVYAMVALADDWPDQRQACIDVLCGYLRMPYESEQGNGKQRERETRLSIIRAIRDHLRRDVEVGWNRQPPRPPSVAFSPWDSATNTLLAPRELVTGFQNEGGTRWGRSVTAVPGPDRSIYLTDDQAGLVYRLTPPA